MHFRCPSNRARPRCTSLSSSWVIAVLFLPFHCQAASVGCTYVDLDGSDSEVDWGDDSVEVVAAPPSAIAECRSPSVDIPPSVDTSPSAIVECISPSGGDDITIIIDDGSHAEIHIRDSAGGEVRMRRRGSRGGWRKQRQEIRRVRSDTSTEASPMVSTPLRSGRQTGSQYSWQLPEPFTAEKKKQPLSHGSVSKRRLYDMSPTTPPRRPRRWDPAMTPWRVAEAGA